MTMATTSRQAPEICDMRNKVRVENRPRPRDTM